MSVVLLGDIVIISIIVIITLMIYRDVKFLLSPISTSYKVVGGDVVAVYVVNDQ